MFSGLYHALINEIMEIYVFVSLPELKNERKTI